MNQVHDSPNALEHLQTHLDKWSSNRKGKLRIGSEMIISTRNWSAWSQRRSASSVTMRDQRHSSMASYIVIVVESETLQGSK